MKGKNMGKLRKVRAKIERLYTHPPKGINAYKANILEHGETLSMSDRRYRYVEKPSHRLTRVHGPLIENLRDDKGLLTGETKQHMRHSVQLVRQ